MKKLLFAMVFILLGCDPTPEQKAEENSRRISSDGEWLEKNLSYFKDERTNLCYASWSPGYNSGLIANVPCTLEVEKVAHTFKSSL